MWDLNNWFESQVSESVPIRVWHLVALLLIITAALIVLGCCFLGCRIPRTRQQILRERQELQHRNQFNEHLKRLSNIEQPFEIGKHNTLYIVLVIRTFIMMLIQTS